MTRSDDDGPRDRRHNADGPPHADDPVRRSRPVDPWIDEAPTTAVGDATTLPLAAASDETPLTGTAFFDGAYSPHANSPHATRRYDEGTSSGGPSSGWSAAPSLPRRRRPIRWVVSVLGALSLSVTLILAIDQFGSGADDGDDVVGTGPSTGVPATVIRTTAEPAASSTRVPSADVPSAAVPPASAPAADVPSGSVPGAGVPSAGTPSSGQSGAPLVVYQIMASGRSNTGSVSFTDQDGEIIRRSGIALPWRTTFRVGPQTGALILNAQREGGGDGGAVTCTITVDGKELSSTTSYGRYAASYCVGSGRSYG